MGQWLPEPLPGSADWANGRIGEAVVDPADRVSLDESITMAFLVLLESMTPAERVAFILHDVFRYPFADVADVVGRTPAACRQLASSARRRLRTARGSRTPAARPGRLVQAFKHALEAGEVDVLLSLLVTDATMTADGGGLAKAALWPIYGREKVARYLIGVVDRAPQPIAFTERTVSGWPGLVAHRDGHIETVFAFELDGEHISRIWAMRNPDKLREWMTP